MKPLRPHPLPVRLSHWLNAVAVFVMVLSGWRIYDASPLFPWLHFPGNLTLGGWLAGALQWHFAAMWLLFVNGLFYIGYNLATGRFRRQFLPLTWRETLGDLRAALTLHLGHDDLSRYNALQKITYLGALAALLIAVLTGLTIWKPVQFPTLRTLFGDYDNARLIHFWAMSAIVAFTLVHVFMVLLVPQTLKLMVGRWVTFGYGVKK